MKIRPLENKDLPFIRDILERCGNFRKSEVDVAIELAMLNLSGLSDYVVDVAVDDDDRVIGFICYGLDTLTDGTYLVYWIAVHPDFQARGIGRKLMEHFERYVRENGGRMVVIETSSTEKYNLTREFYLRNGYKIEGILRDYYMIGDSKVIFVKRLK